MEEYYINMWLLRERMGQSLENQLNIKENIGIPGKYTGKTELLRLQFLNL